MDDRRWVPLVGLAITVVTATALMLTESQGVWWAYWLIAAIYALSLWVMLFAGTYAVSGAGRGVVSPRAYSVAGVIAIVLGLLMGGIVDGPTWWAPGFIVAGTLVSAREIRRQGGDSSEGSSR